MLLFLWFKHIFAVFLASFSLVAVEWQKLSWSHLTHPAQQTADIVEYLVVRETHIFLLKLVLFLIVEMPMRDHNMWIIQVCSSINLRYCKEQCMMCFNDIYLLKSKS